MKNVPFFIRSPISAFLYSGLAFFVIWAIAPINYVFTGNLSTLTLALCMPMLLMFGVILGCKRTKTRTITVAVSPRRLMNVVSLVAFFGFSGLFIRLFERIFLRGGGQVSTDFMANREVISSGGSGAVALAGGVLSTLLLFLPFYCFLLRKVDTQKSAVSTILILGSVLFPLSDLLLQGSRSTLIIYLGIFTASWLTLNRLTLQARTFLLILISAIGLVWLGGIVFLLRTTQMGLDPIYSMQSSGYAYFAPPSNALLNFLDQSEIVGLLSLVFSLVHLFQYLTHGLYELFYIISNVSDATTYGLQSFYIPAKIILSLTSPVDVEDILAGGQIRSGIYTTLFGPLIYDFGPWGATTACFFFGLGIGLIARKTGFGKLSLMPLMLVLLGFLPFGFVVNLFVSGTGQYTLISSILLAFVLTKTRFRISY